MTHCNQIDIIDIYIIHDDYLILAILMMGYNLRNIITCLILLIISIYKR